MVADLQLAVAVDDPVAAGPGEDVFPPGDVRLLQISRER